MAAWNFSAGRITWSAGMTTIVAFGSLRLTSSAANPMQGAVSRLQGSPTIAAAGSSGSCLPTASTSRLLVTTIRRSLRHQVAEAIEGLAEHRGFADELQQLLGRVVAARGPESGAGAAGHDDCVEHGMSYGKQGRGSSRDLAVELNRKRLRERLAYLIIRERRRPDRRHLLSAPLTAMRRYSGCKYVVQVVRVDAADGECWQLDFAATSRRYSKPGELANDLVVDVNVGPGPKIVGAVEDGRPGLLDVVRRDADQHSRADDRRGRLLRSNLPGRRGRRRHRRPRRCRPDR